VLGDPLTKGLPPKCSENTQSTWVYGKAYDFWITKGPSVYFEMDKCTVAVASDGTEVTVMMGPSVYRFIEK
jgi:hypothetical protein